MCDPSGAVRPSCNSRIARVSFAMERKIERKTEGEGEGGKHKELCVAVVVPLARPVQGDEMDGTEGRRRQTKGPRTKDRTDMRGGEKEKKEKNQEHR